MVMLVVLVVVWCFFMVKVGYWWGICAICSICDCFCGVGSGNGSVVNCGCGGSVISHHNYYHYHQHNNNHHNLNQLQNHLHHTAYTLIWHSGGDSGFGWVLMVVVVMVGYLW